MRILNVPEERGESGAAAGAEAYQASGQMSAGGNVPLYRKQPPRFLLQ